MIRFKTTGLSLLGAAGAVGLSAAPALAHEGDIGLQNIGGAFSTWLVEEVGGVEIFAEPERVFGVEMGPGGRIDDPGFYTDGVAAVGLDGVALSFVLEGRLREWNGTEFVDSTNTMDAELEFGPSVTTSSDGSDVAGFVFENIGGAFDTHLDFVLGSDDVGIFALQMRLVDDNGGLDDSRSFWISFNNGDEEEAHEESIEWLVANVPAPGAVASLLFGGALVGGRRRRNG